VLCEQSLGHLRLVDDSVTVTLLKMKKFRVCIAQL
jgi:hypothetical protein